MIDVLMAVGVLMLAILAVLQDRTVTALQARLSRDERHFATCVRLDTDKMVELQRRVQAVEAGPGSLADVTVLESRIKHLEARFLALLNHWDENLSNALGNLTDAAEEVEQDFDNALGAVANVKRPGRGAVDVFVMQQNEPKIAPTWEQIVARPIQPSGNSGCTHC